MWGTLTALNDDRIVWTLPQKHQTSLALLGMTIMPGGLVHYVPLPDTGVGTQQQLLPPPACDAAVCKLLAIANAGPTRSRGHYFTQPRANHANANRMHAVHVDINNAERIFVPVDLLH